MGETCTHPSLGKRFATRHRQQCLRSFDRIHAFTAGFGYSL